MPVPEPAPIPVLAEPPALAPAPGEMEINSLPTPAAPPAVPLMPGDITTIVEPQFRAPDFNLFGVVVDNSGNIYFSESASHNIKKVAANTGAIDVVAGYGRPGYSGSGTAGTASMVDTPRGIAIDANGNLLIADQNNNRVRRLDRITGSLTHVAGNGANGYQGDGGSAMSARLSKPQDVALDSNGNLFIADMDNHCIRRVDAVTGIITTYAGIGRGGGFSGDGYSAISARLSKPQGVAVDGNGNLFIADRDNHRIRRVDINGNIMTVAGTGTQGFSGDGASATSANLNFPSGVAVDNSDILFIADSSNNRIRRVDSSGNISTVAGTGVNGFSGDGGPATSAKLKNPFGVALDGSGNLLIADTGNNRIRKVNGPFT